MTLLDLLAIPSFVVLCFLAAAHTFQTMNMRLEESIPSLPAEALLREYFPLPADFLIAQPARVRTYDRLAKNCASPSRRLAFAKDSNVSRVLRAQTFSLRDYARSSQDFDCCARATASAFSKCSCALPVSA